MDMVSESDQRAQWRLLSNHHLILLYLAEHPDATVRQIGDAVGVTERSAASILRDLRASGYVHVTKVGRRNHYELDHCHVLDQEVNGRRVRVTDLLAGVIPGPESNCTN